MITAETLDTLTNAQLATIILSHERDLQKYRNARRPGIFVTREISQGIADTAWAILRRRHNVEGT